MISHHVPLVDVFGFQDFFFFVSGKSQPDQLSLNFSKGLNIKNPQEAEQNHE